MAGGDGGGADWEQAADDEEILMTGSGSGTAGLSAAEPEGKAEEAAATPTDNGAAAEGGAMADGQPRKVAEEEPPAEIVEEEVAEADSREHLNIVFIGHVDAGKSTLSGNILYLTDYVDRRTIEKYEREAKQRNRESWFLAFIMDTNEEERAKGKTVEVGRAYFATANKRYTVLDAPGHKSYVPNMISGASQADIGVLVISARKGEFEAGFDRGGQTREHAMLAKTLGVKFLIVVINKMDEPTVRWEQGRFDEIVGKMKPFLKSCGFKVSLSHPLACPPAYLRASHPPTVTARPLACLMLGR